MSDLWQYSYGGKQFHGQTQLDDCQTQGQLKIDSQNEGVLTHNNQQYRVYWSSDAQGIWVTCQGKTFLFQSVAQRIGGEQDQGSLMSPMPAKVLQIPVSVGDYVSRGDVLMRLEAMKMEHALIAPQAGTVREINAHENDQVDSGVILVVIE